LRGGANEIRSIRRIDDGETIGIRPRVRIEHIVYAGVTPPTTRAVVADFVCWSRTHLESPLAGVTSRTKV
jgi:hypothetical protein